MSDIMMKPVEKKDALNTDTSAGEKPSYMDVGIKGLIATPEVQSAFLKHVKVPEKVLLKKLKNPYDDKEKKIKTQKVEAMSGASLTDAVVVSFTLVNTELDPVKSVNHWFRLAEYTFALESSMTGGKFGGYATSGLKLLVTRIEEVKENV